VNDVVGDGRKDETEFTLEESVANNLLRVASQVGAEALGQFSGWLLGGTATALAIVLANLDILVRFVTIDEVRRTVIALLVALTLGVIARYVGMIAASGATSGARGEALAPVPSVEIDFERVFRHVQDVTWRPARWILQRQLTKLRKEGLIAANGFLFNAAQLHAALVFVDATIVIAALGYLTYCLVA